MANRRAVDAQGRDRRLRHGDRPDRAVAGLLHLPRRQRQRRAWATSSASTWTSTPPATSTSPAARARPTSRSSPPLQGTLRGTEDAFVTKLAPGGAPILYSTYLGGTASDEARALTVDAAGLAFVTGRAGSSDFPPLSPVQASLRRGRGRLRVDPRGERGEPAAIDATSVAPTPTTASGSRSTRPTTSS